MKINKTDHKDADAVIFFTLFCWKSYLLVKVINVGKLLNKRDTVCLLIQTAVLPTQIKLQKQINKLKSSLNTELWNNRRGNSVNIALFHLRRFIRRQWRQSENFLLNAFARTSQFALCIVFLLWFRSDADIFIFARQNSFLFLIWITNYFVYSGPDYFLVIHIESYCVYDWWENLYLYSYVKKICIGVSLNIMLNGYLIISTKETFKKQ